MPTPRIDYIQERLEWREAMRAQLRANGASECAAQAYERLGSMEGPLIQIYLETRTRRILIVDRETNSRFEEITVDEVRALGARAIV